MTDKASLRQLYLAKRRALSHDHVVAWSQRIQQAVLDSAQFQAAACLALYVPIHNEVDTAKIIQTAWEMKKTVGLPHWDPESGTIRFYQVSPSSPLHQTDWGTQEPEPIRAAELPTEDIELILVPGIAFDTQRFRLGYGHGGYDRLLANYAGTSWGLAYETQVIDSFPHEPHDVPCSRIITERRQIEAL